MKRRNCVYAEVCMGTDQHEGHETGNQGKGANYKRKK